MSRDLQELDKWLVSRRKDGKVEFALRKADVTAIVARTNSSISEDRRLQEKEDERAKAEKRKPATVKPIIGVVSYGTQGGEYWSRANDATALLECMFPAAQQSWADWLVGDLRKKDLERMIVRAAADNGEIPFDKVYDDDGDDEHNEDMSIVLQMLMHNRQITVDRTVEGAHLCFKLTEKGRFQLQHHLEE